MGDKATAVRRSALEDCRKQIQVDASVGHITKAVTHALWLDVDWDPARDEWMYAFYEPGGRRMRRRRLALDRRAL